MTGLRLAIGAIVMGVAVPLILFFLLDLHSLSNLFTICAVTLFSWGLADLLVTILARPRLKDRSPGRALREDWERRKDG